MAPAVPIRSWTTGPRVRQASAVSAHSPMETVQASGPSVRAVSPQSGLTRSLPRALAPARVAGAQFLGPQAAGPRAKVASTTPRAIVQVSAVPVAVDAAAP